MIEFLITVAFLSVTALILFMTFRAKERLSALEKAWPHRQRLAELAAELENDEKAPESVKEFVGFLADHAFDSTLQRKYIKMTLDAKKNAQNQHSSRKVLKKHFGSEYIDKVSDSARAFAEISAWENRHFCLSLIRSKHKLGKNKTQHQKKQEDRVNIQTIIKEFFNNEKNDNNGTHAHA